MTDPIKCPGFGERAFVALQYLLPQHALSRLVFSATRSTRVWWKNLLIRSFLSGFAVDMSEAAEPDPFAYASFNDFFTRALRPTTRPIDSAPQNLVSPVDGIVSEAGQVQNNLLLQAKGHYYSLEALFAGDALLAGSFRDGHFATLYLAPHNYHRIHMPLAGTLVSTIHVPGQLFSVNTTTVAQVSGLFARNERIICVFDTEHGRLALILVGALFVGSMSTVWAGDITPSDRTLPALLPLPAQPLHLDRGAEMGRFNMGSTVIVLLESGRVRWTRKLVAGSAVRIGEGIGHLTLRSPAGVSIPQ